ncbi:MAG: PIN domain-containing protein [Ferrovibrio sp.]|uniref:PIN domain-containing protein n=1 Tax=Ferrovibrio sp. TaxID=1917215 RepID=UPI00262E9AE8|nr:PIN domain-containing protein [Ferrovibrio sp.]MCW0236295.1 PIN domain-containing protein [Ferrovibrio sp.]
MHPFQMMLKSGDNTGSVSTALFDLARLSREPARGMGVPKASDRKLKKLIADKAITAISLDTSIFDQRGRALEHGHLRLMSQFKTGNYRFVMPEVIEQELRHHMVKAANESKAALDTAMKSICSAWNFPRQKREEVVADVLGDAEPAAGVDTRMKAYSANTGFVQVGSKEFLDPTKMIEMYIGVQPPFEPTAKKKHEFPDAMALLSLEAYAEKNDTQILCVTTDGGWFAYAENSKAIYCIKDLGTALSLFPQNGEWLAGEFAKRLEENELPELAEEIESQARSYFEGAEIDVSASSSYMYEEYVNNQVLNGVELDYTSAILVDGDEETISIELTGTANVKVEVDFSFSTIDGIDKDEISLGSDEHRVETDLEFKVVVTIPKDVHGKIEEFTVEVDHFDTSVDFGGVEPSFGWGDYDDDDGAEPDEDDEPEADQED